MVRTRADAGGTKVAGAKAPRKVFSSPSLAGPSMAGSPSGKAGKYSGGNGYNPQPTPDWQKGINSFFKEQPKPKEGEGSSSNSGDGGNAEDMEGNSSNSGGGGGNAEDMEGNSSNSGGGNAEDMEGGSSTSGRDSGRSSPTTEPMEQEREGSGKSFEKNGMISDDDE